mgnify:CR=1 FL=1
MKKIKFNGKTLAVTAGEERMLATVYTSNFLAGKDQFVEGRGRHQRSLLTHANLEALGVREVWKDYPTTEAEREYFKLNPRRQYVISGAKRKVKAILKKLEGKA